MCEEDDAANQRALRDGERLLSVYSLPLASDPGTTTRVYVITEPDWSATTALLPEEY